jgi:hypothetical protein
MQMYNDGGVYPRYEPGAVAVGVLDIMMYMRERRPPVIVCHAPHAMNGGLGVSKSAGS